MGAKQVRKTEGVLINRMLFEAFKDTKFEFAEKEVMKLKLRFKDAESYFNRKFDYVLFFNNLMFHEGVSTLYDNYSAKIESFTEKKKIFYLFVDFDDENDAFDKGYDLEFDSLFSIVFEKLEINNVAFFSLLNASKNYLKCFFEQMYESVYFYKTNRKFDSLYFLLPNSDFLIKNENCVMYIASKNNVIKKHVGKYKAKYSKFIFNSFYFKELVNVQYPQTESNEKLNDFLVNVHYSPFIKCVYKINLLFDDIGIFLSNYESMCEFHSKIANKTEVLQLYIFLDKNSILDYNYNLGYLIKNLVTNFEKANFAENEMSIKILNYETEKNEKLQNNLGYIDKLIQMLITDAFKRGEQKRKLSIEYYEVYKYKIKGPKKSIQMEQQIVLTDVMESKINKVNTFSESIMNNNKNKKLDDSIENQSTKSKTNFSYKIEKVQYRWFVSHKELSEIKKLIIKWIKTKNKILYQNESKRKNLLQLIFSFVFTSKNKMFYYTHKVLLDNQKSQIDFEENFFL